MHTFEKSDILDTAALDRTLAAAPPPLTPDHVTSRLPDTSQNSDPAQNRKHILAVLQDALTTGRERLHQKHLQGASGHAIVHGHAHLMDTVLSRIYRSVHHDTTGTADRFTLVATGGYGRGELAPFSDIDLLFLLPTEPASSRWTARKPWQSAPSNPPESAGTQPNTSPINGKRSKPGPSPTLPSADTATARIERMLYCLWDLRLDVGHAVRTIDDCVQLARQNVEIRTSLLESRFLIGDRALFERYYTTLCAKVLERGPEAFLRAKLVEQNKRHERFGNSLFYLEPNVKENPGGLRDLQTFSWISKYRYQAKTVHELVIQNLITQEEYNTFARCQSFLRRVRNALHYRAGRREDRLTFQHQVDLAAEFGYKDRRGMRGVELFMRRYYKNSCHVSNLSWIFLRKYQEEHRRLYWWNRHALEGCFYLHGDKITVSHPDVFRQDPTCLMQLFEVGQRHLKSIHPETMRLVTRDVRLVDQKFRKNPAVSALFLKMLTSKKAVAWVLRRMNISGVLGRYLPEFGRIIGQSQYDLFHIYTVDEHTILAIEALRHIKSDKFRKELPICTALMHQLAFHDKGSIILYLAVLLHDIAKGRGGDHQLKGALIARQVCLRLGLSESITGMVSWLVGRHLLFSRTAFHRDISDPETVSQFARQISTQQRLDFLLLLTVADIRAVGPGVWNLWKANLLRRLYNLTLVVLKRGAFRPEELKQLAETKKQAVLDTLRIKADLYCVRQHLDRFEADYFLHYDEETITKHTLALIAKEAEHGPTRSCHDPRPLDHSPRVVTIFFAYPTSDTTEVLIYTQDRPGLIARISGTLALESVNILSADITTTVDGMALDVFVVQNSLGKALEEGPFTQQLELKLTRMLTNTVPLKPLLLEQDDRETHRKRAFDVPFSIETDDSLDIYTILEITSLDRVGLLFTITREIEQHGIQIRMAKIATYGEKAVDIFYVRDLYGLKLVPKKIANVAHSLKTALAAMDHEKQQRRLFGNAHRTTA